MLSAFFSCLLQTSSGNVPFSESRSDSPSVINSNRGTQLEALDGITRVRLMPRTVPNYRIDDDDDDDDGEGKMVICEDRDTDGMNSVTMHLKGPIESSIL